MRLGSYNRELRRRCMPPLPARRKTVLCRKRLLASSWAFQDKNQKHALSDNRSDGTRAETVDSSVETVGKDVKNASTRKTHALTSMGERQSSVYSGAIIQIVVGCSALIKQRRFQRMHSMWDFQASTVSTLYLKYQMTARSKIIVVRGR